MKKTFRPFGKQKKFLKSRKRILGAFAGKRCINPQSKILLMDGVKEFCDIRQGDQILSFDPMAKRFLHVPCTASFPKSKSDGFRVVHEQGEFVASEHHLVFCSDYRYRSLLEINSLPSLDAIGPTGTFLCPSQTIEELSQSAFLLNAQHLMKKLSGYQGNYLNDIHQYDLRLQLFQEVCQSLLQPLVDALQSSPLYGQKVFSYLDGLVGRVLRHIHLGQYDESQSIFYYKEMVECLPFVFLEDSRLFGISLLSPRLRQQELQFLLRFLFDLIEKQLNQFYSEKLKPCSSSIIKIERVSSRWWWDTQVEGTNNYVSGGAIHHNSGKTECGAIKSIMLQEQKPDWTNNGIDPYLGIIIAPTYDMLRRLSWKKFSAYALPFIKSQTKSPMEISWHDGSEVYGISADKPERLEGVKASWIWIDEVFQCKEQIYLEALARLADSKGTLICTGSLGVQFVNPTSHWAYKYFKEIPDSETECFEWSTSENPHFPQDELARMKNILDPMTFKQMFEIDWDTTPLNAVYPDFSVDNILEEIPYKPHLETYVSIDWGWSHPMACLIFQYDRVNDTVYLIDELIESKTTLEMLHKWIMEKNYFINGWDCDIAGNQEREQTGISNVTWFKSKGIKFKFRATAVAYGLPIVRSYILNGAGQRKLFIASKNKKTIECIKKYRYPDKDGKILNENPLKLDDDAADSLRYFFVNFLDRNLKTEVKVYNYL